MTSERQEAVDNAFQNLGFYLKRIIGQSDFVPEFNSSDSELMETLGSVRGDIARIKSQLDILFNLGMLTDESHEALSDNMDDLFGLAYLSNDEKIPPDIIADRFIEIHNNLLRFRRKIDEIRFIP